MCNPAPFLTYSTVGMWFEHLMGRCTILSFSFIKGAKMNEAGSDFDLHCQRDLIIYVLLQFGFLFVSLSANFLYLFKAFYTF